MTNRYFTRQITPADVVKTYSGVRPLLQDDRTDASAVTRDYWLELNVDAAPVLSVFGGKITTFRRLAEEAMDLLLPALGASSQVRQHWTAHHPLPGGEFDELDYEGYVTRLTARLPWLPAAVAARYVRAYGSRVWLFLEHAKNLADLGAEVAAGVFEVELRYLVEHEWARSADDILWRRSKLGLHLSPSDQAAIARWLSDRHAARATFAPRPSVQNQIG